VDGSGAPTDLHLALAPGVKRTWSGLHGSTGHIQLTDGPLLDALEEGATLQRLLEVGTPRAGHDVRGVLEVLHQHRLIAWQARDAEDRPWASLVPLRSDLPLPDPTTAVSEPDARLSRFALMRLMGDSWLVESGRSPFAVILSDEAAAAITSGSATAELRRLLAMGRLLDDSDDDGLARYWEFHDRYFASRSRMDGPPSGGTFRFAGIHDPEPPISRPPLPGEVVSLPVPDPEDAGPGLWQVTARRSSRQDASDEPVTLGQLGSLLWHTLRITDVRPRNPNSPTSYDAIWRPVPSGGATHSIGLWLGIHHVSGIDAGVWWYDPEDHALVRTGEFPQQGGTDPAVIHGMLLSRHARLAWKYEGIAHALALKDSGVILHALQLGATALGLAMCPIGSGPTASVLAALGLDEDEYVPVGEFWLAVPR
jgi:SagB-type dehydrogenase family enzyme